MHLHCRLGRVRGTVPPTNFASISCDLKIAPACAEAGRGCRGGWTESSAFAEKGQFLELRWQVQRAEEEQREIRRSRGSDPCASHIRIPCGRVPTTT